MLWPNMSHLNLTLAEIQGVIPAEISDVINITVNMSSNQLNRRVPASIYPLLKR
jgi:hypothetical protein